MKQGIIKKIVEEATRQQVDPRLAVAIADVESSFKPFAVSEKGARGVMQLMPATAAKWKVNIDDVGDNIRGGVSELKALNDEHRNDVTMVLRRYNASPQADPSVTQPYVDKVTNKLLTEYRTLKLPDTQTGTTTATTPTQSAFKTDMPAEMRVMREVLPLTGMMIGGSKGYQMGRLLGPIPGFIGALTGAGIGAMGGEAAQIGVEESARAMGVEGISPLSLQGMMQRTGQATVQGVENEAFGQAFIAALSRVGGPMRGYLQPYAQEMIRDFTDQYGHLRLLPASVSKSWLLQVFQNIAEGSLLGGGRITKARQAQEAQAGVKLKELVDQIGPQANQQQVVRELQAKLPPTPKAQAQATFRPLKTIAEAGVPVAKAGVTRAEAGVAAAERTEQAVGKTVAAAGEDVATAGKVVSARKRELTTAQQQLATQKAENLAAAERQANDLEMRAQQQGAPLGEAPTVKEAGQAALAARETAIQAWKQEEKAAWRTFDDLGNEIEVTESPALDALIEEAGVRTRGAIIPNAGLSVAKRVADMAAPPIEDLSKMTDVGQITPTTMVQIGGQKIQFRNAPASVQEAIMDGIEERAAQAAAKGGGELVEAGTVPEPPLTATQFAKTLSDLKIVVQQLFRKRLADPQTYGKQHGMAKRVLIAAIDDYYKLLERTNPKALEAYQAAVNSTRTGNALYNNPRLRQLAKQDPEALVDLFTTKNKSTRINQLTAAIGEQGMAPIRAAAWPKLIKRDVTTGAIDWVATKKNLNSIGADTLNALFPRREHEGLHRFADAMFETEVIARNAEQNFKQAAAQAGQRVANATNGVRQAQERLADAKATLATAKGETAEARAFVTSGKAVLRQAEQRVADAQKALSNAVAQASQVPDPLGLIRKQRDTNKVLDLLSDPDNVPTIEAVRRVAGPQGMKQIERVMMQRILTPGADGKVHFGEVAKKLQSMNPQTFDALYPGGHAAQIRKFVNTVQEMEHKPWRKAGLYAISAGQFLALGAAASGYVDKRAGLIFFGPWALAHVLSNPAGAYWLTVGLTAPRGSRTGVRAIAHITGLLMRETGRTDVLNPTLPERQPMAPLGQTVPLRPGPSKPNQPQLTR